MKLERIQKLIAQAGITSRHQAEKLIQQGHVKVNNKIANLGDKATFEDQITVNDVVINKTKMVYFLINKPSKTLTSLKKQDDRGIITDFLPPNQYVFPVGRLDYNTSGTLILTNDGELAYRLTHPKYEIKRIYKVKLDRDLTSEEIKYLNSNNVIVDHQKSWQKITPLDSKTYQVILKQGLNHHVKKLFWLVNCEVRKLQRTQFANLSHVNNLKPGQYRHLTNLEVKKLKQLVKL